MDRINGADFIDLGGGKRGFRDEDLPTGVAGTEVTALFLNAVQEEVIGIIEASGLVPNDADRAQLAKAIQSGRLNYVVAGGAANAITGTLTPAPAAYTIGMVINLKVANPNTGPATLNLNGLGVKNIVARDGSPLAAGDLNGLASLIYNGTAFVLDTLPAATEAARGAVELASAAETTAGTDLTRPAAVGRMAAAVQAGTWSFAIGGGTADAITVTLSPPPAAYTDGMIIAVRLSGPNTVTAPTINVNSLGAVPIVNGGGGPLNLGDLNLGPVLLFYRAGVFNIVNFFPATEGGRGVVELASAAEVTAGSDLTRPPSVGRVATGVQSGRWNFAVAGGTANALTASLTPAPTSYNSGMAVNLNVTTPNTGPATLNVNGLGPISIINNDGTPLVANDLAGVVSLIFANGVFVVSNILTATEANRGVVELASAAETTAGSDLARPASVGRMAAFVQSGSWSVANTAGAANTYTAALTPAPSAYTWGMLVSLWFGTANTGASTLNLNGLGALPIVSGDGTPVVANDLSGNITLLCGGTVFIMLSSRPANETRRGLVQLADATTTNAGADLSKPASVGRMATAVQSGRWNYAVAGGTANAITAAISPGPTSWNAMIGMPVRLVMQSSPTGAATFNPNGLGAVSIVKRGGGAIADKEWLPGDIVELMYDGTVVRMIAAQRVGLDAAGFQTYSANVTLTILDLGKYTNLNQNCATVILPKASSCPSGSVIALHNTRAGLSNAVQAAAGDDITLGESGAGAGLTSFSMANQESVLLVAYSAGNNWVAVTGSTQTRFTPSFKSSLGGSPGSLGFKRTPDASSPTGFIIEQWGFLTAAAANTAQLVTLPTAFPTTLLHCVASSGNSGVAAGVSNNGGSVSNIAAWAGAAGAGIFWRAWGY